MFLQVLCCGQPIAVVITSFRPYFSSQNVSNPKTSWLLSNRGLTITTSVARPQKYAFFLVVVRFGNRKGRIFWCKTTFALHTYGILTVIGDPWESPNSRASNHQIVIDKRKMVRPRTKERFRGNGSRATQRKYLFSHCLSKIYVSLIFLSRQK